MRKTKRVIREVVQSMSSELKEKFPDLEFETVENPGDGYDVWLRIYIPGGTKAAEKAVRHEAYQMADELDRTTDVGIMPLIRTKEAVHG